jgi:hypothetical protein
MQIEKNIPIPDVVREKVGRKRSELRELIEKMEISDSIYVPPEKFPPAGIRSSNACAAVAARRMGFRVVSRKEGDGLRIWRFA